MSAPSSARRIALAPWWLALLVLASPAPGQADPAPSEPAPSDPAQVEPAPAEAAEPEQDEAPGEAAETTEPSEAAPALITVTQFASASSEAVLEIEAIAPDTGVDGRVEEIRSRVHRWESELEADVDLAEAELARAHTLADVDAVRSRWVTRGEDIADIDTVLTDSAERLTSSLDRLQALRQRWQDSVDALEADAPRGARDTGAEILSRIADLQPEIETRRRTVIDLQNQAAGLALKLGELTKACDARETALRQSLFTADAPPIWESLADDVAQFDHENLATRIGKRITEARDFATSRSDRLLFQGLIVVALLTVLLLLRRATPPAEHVCASAADGAEALRRPMSAALLVGLLLGLLLYVRPSTGFVFVNRLLAAAAALRFLLPLLPPRTARSMVVATGFFVFDMARDLFVVAPGLGRLALLGEALVLGAVLLLTRRPADTGPRFLRWAERTGLVLAGLAVLFLALGFVSLGELLVSGFVLSAAGAFIFLAGGRALASLIALSLHTRPMMAIHAVRNHGDLVRFQLVRVVRLIIAVAFTLYVLRIFGIRDITLEALRDALTAPLVLGQISISVGDVLAFVVVIWISFQISKALSFLLREDVFARMDLPRGVPHAASMATHYAILTLGFFLALGAAGVDMGRFAVLGGALGVGVGFGLQNVVNNFVSGLILLFERPVQIGDYVEVGTIFGQIERIGIRSSTVRTFEGAQIIVPNASLISENVTNWTLSDRQRRAKIEVAVAYGTDPAVVQEILMRIAREHPEVLDDPEPWVLFQGFGDSALRFELYAWVARFEQMWPVRNELTQRIYDALGEAGIALAFPQHVVHMAGDGGTPDARPAAQRPGAVPPPGAKPTDD